MIQIDEFLVWFFGLVTIWGALSLAVQVTFEKTYVPVIDKFLEGYTGSYKIEIRNTLIVVAVIVVSFWLAIEQNVNLFRDFPFDYLNGMNENLLVVLSGILIAGGSFISHEIWDWILAKVQTQQRTFSNDPGQG